MIASVPCTEPTSTICLWRRRYAQLILASQNFPGHRRDSNPKNLKFFSRTSFISLSPSPLLTTAFRDQQRSASKKLRRCPVLGALLPPRSQRQTFRSAASPQVLPCPAAASSSKAMQFCPLQEDRRARGWVRPPHSFHAPHTRRRSEMGASVQMRGNPATATSETLRLGGPRASLAEGVRFGHPLADRPNMLTDVQHQTLPARPVAFRSGSARTHLRGHAASPERLIPNFGLSATLAPGTSEQGWVSNRSSLSLNSPSGFRHAFVRFGAARQTPPHTSTSAWQGVDAIAHRRASAAKPAHTLAWRANQP